MSAAQKLKELHAQKAELFKAANAADAANDETKYQEAKEKILATNKAIERAQFLLDAEMAEPVPADPEREAHLEAEKRGQPVFRSLGDQLQAVYRAATQGTVDPRLIKAAYPGQGLNETVPDAGGFAVQQDFASTILQRMYDQGQILSRVDRVRVSGNGLVIPRVDESSRATGSRLGGIQGYWGQEGGTPTSSRPKVGQLSMRLEKVYALGYITDELMQDAPALAQIMSQGAQDELTFLTEDAIVNGDGVGKPLGFTQSDCYVTATKVSGQTATTFVLGNVGAIWERSWARGRTNGVWLINQDVEGQLHGMTAATAPVYLPNGNVAGSPFGTLYGRPVIPVEYCATMGTASDVIFAELPEYLLIEKGGIESASSMHVAFVTGEQCFRFTYRVNGQPKWNAALTPFKGTKTQSPFVTVETRS